MAASRKSSRSNLPARVGAFLAARKMSDGRIGVGLSGGCDSVVLLHVLVGLGLGERLQAIHVHHGLSPNADRWARFCADYCGRLGVELRVEHVAVDRTSGLGLEAAARHARYRVFAACSPDELILGHHQDDQAETVLFNLMRGAGVTGAAGIPPERRQGRLRVLRPLLGCSRQEVEIYAKAHQLAWVDDESNLDTVLSRNFLRHQAFPLLAGRFPAAPANLALAASHFAEADALLGELAAIDWQTVSVNDSARLADLRGLSPLRLKNLLRYRLRQLGWQVPGADRLEEFCRQVQSAGPDRHPVLELSEGHMLASKGVLRWLARG